jgi:hypothetical protein
MFGFSPKSTKAGDKGGRQRSENTAQLSTHFSSQLFFSARRQVSGNSEQDYYRQQQPEPDGLRKRLQPIPPADSLDQARQPQQQQPGEQQNEERIEMESRRNLSVQEPMGGTQPAATGALQTR